MINGIDDYNPMASTRNESTSLLAEIANSNTFSSGGYSSQANVDQILDMKQQSRNSLKTNIFGSNTSDLGKRSLRKPESPTNVLPTMLGKYLNQNRGSMSSRMKKVTIGQKKGE